MKDKIVVYQAIMGGRDNFYPPAYLPDDVDHFTIVGQGDKNPLDAAKKFKILPHRYFREYDISVWMDGNYQLTGDIREVVNRFMDKADWAVLRHPAENLKIIPSVYREAEVAIMQKVVKPDAMKRQMESYRKEGLPKGSEVVMNSIIIRRHNKPKIIKFDEAWWRELNRFTMRDQISFPYLAWKYRLKYVKLNNIEFMADWFLFRPHTKERMKI